MDDKRNSYTYDSNENMTSYLNEKWNGANLENHWRNTYTYDSYGKMTSDIDERWVGANWMKFVRTIYTYDSNGNMTSKTSELSMDGTNWMNDLRRTFTYDSNENMTLMLIDKWDGANWESDRRYVHTFDSNGNMTSGLIERWDGANWVNSTYNSYFNFTDGLENYYSFLGCKIDIYYKTITNVEEENISFTYRLQQNYPNPFNPSTTISYSLPQSGFVQLKVYDMLGREVADLVSEEQSIGNYKIEFNASHLTSGVYFYRFQSGDFTETKKLILLR